MSVSSFSDYESDEDFVIIPKDKNEELPYLLNGTKRRKPTLDTYVSPHNMRDTVYRCKEFPQGIYIDRFGKAQPDDERTGVFVEKENDEDGDEEDDSDSDEDEEAQRFITASPANDNNEDDEELNDIWLSKVDKDYEDTSPRSVKRRKVEEDEESPVNDDNWIEYMSEEQRQEYEKTIQAVEKGHNRQKRIQHLNRVLAQVQTFEELMEPLVKSKKYAKLLKYKMDQDLFGSSKPYSTILFRLSYIRDAHMDIEAAQWVWKDKSYKKVDEFVKDLVLAVDHIDVTIVQDNLKESLPGDLVNIVDNTQQYSYTN